MENNEIEMKKLVQELNELKDMVGHDFGEENHSELKNEFNSLILQFNKYQKD